jgi:phage-related protein
MQKQIIHSLTGAGMSNEERADYEQMIRGARTTQDLRNIVQTIKQQNAEQRRLINGGAPANSGNPTASTFRPMQ